MKILVVSHKNSLIAQHQKEIEKEFSDDELLFIFRSGSENILSRITSYGPDLLISLNLEGFDMSTLTGGFAYNLLKLRQLHLLLDHSSINSSIFSKPLSLRMEFICPNENEAVKIAEKYPDIPSIHSFEKLPDEYPFTIASKLFNVI